MEYVTARGISYRNEIKTIKKKTDVPLQPIYEAFMNSWEAILDRFSRENMHNGIISILLHKKSNIFSKDTGKVEYDKIILADNGLGLDKSSYKRLEDLRDDSKRHSNLGTGRIQYLHFFNTTFMESVYRSTEGHRKRKVRLSKSDAFLSKNAIMSLDVDEACNDDDIGTIISFVQPLDEKDGDYYASLGVNELKREIIRHFLSLLCENRDRLPQIVIKVFLDNKITEESEVLSSDIPKPDKEDDKLDFTYSKLNEKNRIVESNKKSTFHLKAFKRPSSEVRQNAIFLVSKGATGTQIELDSLQKNEEIDGNRYMFLLSGDYLDESDRDDRGNIRLISSQEFRHQNENNLFPEEVVLLDTIVQETNKSINTLYKEFEEKSNEKNVKIDELQRMFLLNQRTIDKIRKKVKITDSDEKILKMVYEADSEIEAEKDNEIKQQICEIKSLTPSKDESYKNEISERTDKLLVTIPLQNRTALSKYVARRQIVLELFELILKKELESLKSEKRIDEKLLHNLLFQQSTVADSPEDSDLWLINEEFIYFKGVSEYKFEDIEYLGKRIFDKEFSEEDKRYLTSLGERRLAKRPDVLLFPEEHKAIIIEFKAPDVNVAEHLTQIDFYANLLLNYTTENLHLTSFYGYLIGEEIEDRDVRGRVSRFEVSPNFKYWFRPSERVTNFNGGPEGSIYVEVIKYSTLLERAKLRNRIFINKLSDGEKKQKNFLSKP